MVRLLLEWRAHEDVPSHPPLRGVGTLRRVAICLSLVAIAITRAPSATCGTSSDVDSSPADTTNAATLLDPARIGEPSLLSWDLVDEASKEAPPRSTSGGLAKGKVQKAIGRAGMKLFRPNEYRRKQQAKTPKPPERESVVGPGAATQANARRIQRDARENDKAKGRHVRPSLAEHRDPNGADHFRMPKKHTPHMVPNPKFQGFPKPPR